MSNLIVKTQFVFIIFVYQVDSGEVVREKLGVPCDPGPTPTLPIIFFGIQVKGEYGWRRFVLDGRRGFTDYSIVVSLDGWRSGFRASGRAKGLAAVE
ncbi:hypothetical protein HanOQP8_Chr17g0675381 [Helianthus annuus]|nr:hypothetical protein HanOQP8_Chr17g0675381 [Helianthus annuus]